MFKDRYSNLLTIILVVTLVAIIGIIVFVSYNIVRKYKNNRAATAAIEDFQSATENETESSEQNLIEQNIVVDSNEGSSGQSKRNVKYYNGFVMIGYIEIPKIKIKYPILEEESVASLEQSVAVRYPTHAKLNEDNNVVIAGHNYRNGMFFSNLKKVEVGDTVKITDESGKTLTYTIYDVYETNTEDTEYITRDTGEDLEITLVTCTDDNKARIIVKARV